MESISQAISQLESEAKAAVDSFAKAGIQAVIYEPFTLDSWNEAFNDGIEPILLEGWTHREFLSSGEIRSTNLFYIYLWNIEPAKTIIGIDGFYSDIEFESITAAANYIIANLKK